MKNETVPDGDKVILALCPRALHILRKNSDRHTQAALRSQAFKIFYVALNDIRHQPVSKFIVCGMRRSYQVSYCPLVKCDDGSEHTYYALSGHGACYYNSQILT